MAKEQGSVVWLRLPKGVNLEKLRKAGLAETVLCYGSSTCVAAPDFKKESGIVVQGAGDFASALREAGFVPQAACFGGDTCIV
jgi:hypothetical protein